ncbi:extracellular solute-binding protein [Cohnella abietis]|uniref:Maltose ABC transporter substrate-binding protein n=1 Tax=Cohnella abietis TaxID=2507935 RepID=A0A3T1CZA7_9BACL|nr:extracellular solute-binding protein [Cohnella abietis]BBI31176.1 maltose ABC transporter substrate-binding protein [Cohnella abietis]
MNARSKTVSIVLASMLTVSSLLGACSKDNNANGNTGGSQSGTETKSTETPKPTGKQDVTLSMLIDSANNEQNTSIINQAAEIASKNSTKYNIKVRLDTIPNADKDKKVDVLAAGANLPDLVASGPKQVWMKRGLLADLTDWFNQSPLKDDYMYPSLLEEGKNDGKIYAVPIKADSMFLIYNKDLLQKAGIENTNFTSITWDEWQVMLEKIKQAKLKAKNGKDVKGFTFRISTSESAPFIFSSGGEFFSQDGNEARFDSPEAAEGLAKLKSLVTNGYADKPETDYANWMSVFFNENAAFTITGGWSLSSYKDGGLDLNKLGYSTVPKMKTNTSYFGPGLSFSIFDTSKNKEAAQEFLTAMYTSDIYKQWLELTAGIPVLKSLADDPVFADNPIKGVLGEQLNDIKPIHSDNSPSFWTQYDQLLEKILLTNTDIASEQKTLQSTIQKEISNNLK